MVFLIILPKLKKNKAAGPDGIAADTFLFGTPKLFAHLGTGYLVLVDSKVWISAREICRKHNHTFSQKHMWRPFGGRQL